MTDTFIDPRVQRIQAMLYAKARYEPDIRFKRLYKYLNKPMWVEAAVEKVLRNRGSRTAGCDGKTRQDYRDEKVRLELVSSIQDELRTQTHMPQPTRRVYIPKPNGKKRPLGIANIKDRIVQQMVKMLIEPIFEATFLPCSYGFRPNRCTWDALAETYRYLLPKYHYYTVIEGDIRNCFGTIHHGKLMRLLRKRILDKRLLALIWTMVDTGVFENMQYFKTTEGLPQGSIVSPVLANAYLHRLDEWMHNRFHAISNSKRRYRHRHKGELAYVRYIRYCDDWIVLTREGDQAQQLKQEIAAFISQELKMTLSDEKTAITDAREGFDFLGVRTVVTPKRSDARKLLPYQFPATKSVKAYRNKVRELTHTRLDYLPPGERIRALNWLIQGWANYHRWGNAKAVFSALSYWTCKKVHKMLNRYTPEGKHATYRRNFRSVSECSNLRRWKRYTKWLTPSVAIDEHIRLGVLPMAIISTGDYWRFRGQKIPPAYQLRTNETEYRDRETDFYTDLETIVGVNIGQASRWNTGKYSLAYFHNRQRVFQRDNYTCIVCGYKSQRQKGDVHDLEVHHDNSDGGYEVENLRTVCLPCHHRLTAIR